MRYGQYSLFSGERFFDFVSWKKTSAQGKIFTLQRKM